MVLERIVGVRHVRPDRGAAASATGGGSARRRPSPAARSPTAAGAAGDRDHKHCDLQGVRPSEPELDGVEAAARVRSRGAERRCRVEREGAEQRRLRSDAGAAAKRLHAPVDSRRAVEVCVLGGRVKSSLRIAEAGDGSRFCGTDGVNQCSPYRPLNEKSNQPVLSATLDADAGYMSRELNTSLPPTTATKLQDSTSRAAAARAPKLWLQRLPHAADDEMCVSPHALMIFGRSPRTMCGEWRGRRRDERF